MRASSMLLCKEAILYASHLQPLQYNQNHYAARLAIWELLNNHPTIQQCPRVPGSKISMPQRVEFQVLALETNSVPVAAQRLKLNCALLLKIWGGGGRRSSSSSSISTSDGPGTNIAAAGVAAVAWWEQK